MTSNGHAPQRLRITRIATVHLCPRVVLNYAKLSLADFSIQHRENSSSPSDSSSTISDDQPERSPSSIRHTAEGVRIAERIRIGRSQTSVLWVTRFRLATSPNQTGDQLNSSS
jgi:hypothetical protein